MALTNRSLPPLRISAWRWFLLLLNAAQDCRAGVPYVAAEADDQSVATFSPFLAGIGTKAAVFTADESLRFVTATKHEVIKREALLRRATSARADLALALEGERGAEVVEEGIRRLQRIINATERSAADLATIINDSFRAAQLTTGRFFDFSDRCVAVYWRSLKRRHPRARALRDQPPLLVRPLWLVGIDGIGVLDQWNSLNTPTEGN